MGSLQRSLHYLPGLGSLIHFLARRIIVLEYADHHYIYDNRSGSSFLRLASSQTREGLSRMLLLQRRWVQLQLQQLRQRVQLRLQLQP